jgi:hypothetical protein
MWEPTSEVDFFGVNRKTLKRSPIWRLCFMVSQGRKDTSR